MQNQLFTLTNLKVSVSFQPIPHMSRPLSLSEHHGRLCFFEMHDRESPLSPAGSHTSSTPAASDIIWRSTHRSDGQSSCPSLLWRSGEWKAWLHLWASAGLDCRSLKLYWVSAKALTLPISHHDSSQLSLPSGLIPSPEGSTPSLSVHYALKHRFFWKAGPDPPSYRPFLPCCLRAPTQRNHP